MAAFLTTNFRKRYIIVFLFLPFWNFGNVPNFLSL